MQKQFEDARCPNMDETGLATFNLNPWPPLKVLHLLKCMRRSTSVEEILQLDQAVTSHLQLLQSPIR